MAYIKTLGESSASQTFALQQSTTSHNGSPFLSLFLKKLRNAQMRSKSTPMLPLLGGKKETRNGVCDKLKLSQTSKQAGKPESRKKDKK